MKLLDTEHFIAILCKQLVLNAHVPPQEELGTTAISAAELRAREEPLDQFDLQIASIAIENDRQLLTNDSRHFSRIKSLQLVNWLE